jgi:predicted aldo/keto reductase-like oxidoreductase
MEPLRGGALSDVTDDIRQQMARARKDDTPARWAFRWVGSHPDVLTALSGMNRSLLVTNEYVIKCFLMIIQSIECRHNGTARISEQCLYALMLQ